MPRHAWTVCHQRATAQRRQQSGAGRQSLQRTRPLRLQMRLRSAAQPRPGRLHGRSQTGAMPPACPRQPLRGSSCGCGSSCAAAAASARALRSLPQLPGCPQRACRLHAAAPAGKRGRLPRCRRQTAPRRRQHACSRHAHRSGRGARQPRLPLRLVNERSIAEKDEHVQAKEEAWRGGGGGFKAGLAARNM